MVLGPVAITIASAPLTTVVPINTGCHTPADCCAPAGERLFPRVTHWLTTPESRACKDAGIISPPPEIIAGNAGRSVSSQPSSPLSLITRSTVAVLLTITFRASAALVERFLNKVQQRRNSDHDNACGKESSVCKKEGMVSKILNGLR